MLEARPLTSTIPLLNKPENRRKVADQGNPDCAFHSYRFAA
jgi:hypothetical protein